MTDKQVRIIVIANDLMFREGLSTMLSRLNWVSVIAEAVDGAQGIRLAKAYAPDVIILDSVLRHLNAIDVSRLIVKDCPSVRTILLTGSLDLPLTCSALSAGASGIVWRHNSFDELVLAITTVIGGANFVSPSLSGTLASACLRGEMPMQSNLDRLTIRQRAVLQLVAEGKSSKEIAVILAISTKAVEKHRSQLMERLEIRTIAGLTLFAARCGLVAV